MDEKLTQLHSNLIQSLLDCPNEAQVRQILRVNLELVDIEFLQSCEQVAANLAAQEQENQANFLRRIVSQLREFLGIEEDINSRVIDTKKELISEVTNYEEFLKLVLQYVDKSQGDPQVVYPVLEKYQNYLDDNFINFLRDWGEEKLRGLESKQKISLVTNIIGLTNLIREFNLGNKAINLEIAITGYELLSIVFSRNFGAEIWAENQNNLALAYSNRIKGSRLENLERMIEYCQAALTVRTRKDFPEDWADTQNNLALAYSNRIKGSRAENLERSIEYYQAALTVHTRENFPKDWAMTQHNLAVAYLYRTKGSRAENLEWAIESCQAALTVYKLENFPEKWATTQNNLANAYLFRINGSRAENLEWAIKYYQTALTVYTLEDFPEQWAMTQHNLGEAYRNRINGARAENLERAVNYYQTALTVYTLEDFPEKWATTQNTLALAYSDRINTSAGLSNPGSRAENLERSIEYYQAALTVRTRENFPKDWAVTQNNLAIAYWSRINGSRTENLERAIKHSQVALTVLTREDFPEYWAMTQNNLALAYSDRINGSRTENLEQAIRFYREALTVRIWQAFPIGHVETLWNLGKLYQEEQQWQNAYDTFTAAIDTVELLRGEESTDDNRQKLAEQWNRLYLGTVEACIALKLCGEAVEYAERSKGQNLIELLSVKDLYPKGEIPPQVRQELQSLKERIYAEDQRLKQAPEKNYDLITQLRQQYATLYPYTPLKFSEIQQLADERTVIVEWYILTDSFCVFIITKNNHQPQSLSFPKSDLDKLIDWRDKYLEDYFSNHKEWQNGLETKLARLAEILHIDEVVRAIPKACDKLILIPHLYLHLFPLHAISLNDNRCLLDIFPRGVSYAPSCQILHQVQKYKRGKFDRFFAIQNPTNDLIAADMEVESIKNIFPNPEILVRENAKKGKQSEETLEIAERVANSHHLFFSCHASFNHENPLQSGLQLADGILTLEEILRYFNLKECSLVTLSACETGQVRLDSTDEYISLTSGFLLAGSPSLYVSLWSVNSLSTAVLMIRTYENLYYHPGKIALALNQAQSWLRDIDINGLFDWTKQCHLLNENWRKILQDYFIKETETQGISSKIYQNPFYWAGFCVAGKGEQNMVN